MASDGRAGATDPRVGRALEALAGAREPFRSAAAEAADQARAILATRRASRGGASARAAAELGVFAAGRIDAERFAALVGSRAELDPASAAALERAAAVLEEAAALSPSAYHAAVRVGGDLVGVAVSALARLGRAFGAARVAGLAREGRYRASEHEVWLSALKPSRWSRVERRLAPPLVLEVEGRDLRAGGLAELLDGGQKIVLVVRGATPPAPLVRLVTPGVMVLQTSDPADLARLAAVQGPACAALLPETAARFVHDPAAGATLAERLHVAFLPEPPRAPLGGISAAQQAEELAQLAALAAAVAVAPAARPPAAAPAGAAMAPADLTAGLPPADPADRLAAWLLARADLASPDGGGGP